MIEEKFAYDLMENCVQIYTVCIIPCSTDVQRQSMPQTLFNLDLSALTTRLECRH